MLIYQKHFTASTGDLTVPLFLQSWSSIVILPNCTQTTYNVWPNYHWVKVQHRVKTESSNFDTFSSQEEVSCSKAVPFLNRSRFKICPQNIRNCFWAIWNNLRAALDARTTDRTNEPGWIVETKTLWLNKRGWNTLEQTLGQFDLPTE